MINQKNRVRFDRKRVLFTVLSVLGVFAGLQNASGQANYSSQALEYFKRSLECLIIGDYDNAISNCTVVLRFDPNSAVTYTIRARAHYEKGDMANAIADSTQAIRLDRNNISAYIIRGNAYVRSGNFDRAIADWEAVLRISPENTDARQNIDLARERRGS